jgi:hypothetical protein
MRALSLLLLATAPTAFATSAPANEAIDFAGFVEEASEARQLRAARLVDIDRFNEMAESSGTLILDTRSRAMYEQRHLSGAVHLNFSDITSESLARVLGAPDTRVLIYCNNNFLGDPVSFATKMPAAALNIPTFVTLYTYGYRNVFELADLLSVNDPRLAFEGETVD